MKILYISNVGIKVNNFSYAAMKAAQNLGIEFHVAESWSGYDNPNDKEFDEERLGIKIHQIDFVRAPYDFRNIKAFRQTCDLIKREKIDIIHCNTPVGGLIGRLAGKKCGVKTVIYQSHGFHFYKRAPLKNWMIYYPIERLLAHLTDYLLTINEEDYTNACKFHLRKGGKIFTTLGVGLNTSRFSECKVDIVEYRKVLGLPKDAVVMITVGEIADRKNQAILFEAMRVLNNPDLYLLVCGEGPLLEQYKKICNDYGISNNVLFLGRREDIPELCHASDIYVFPSKREGMGIAPMEGMACGLPLISSNVQGIKDYSKTGVTGYSLEYDDLSGLVEAIRALSDNKELRLKYGNYNKEFVKKYDSENCIAVYERIYREILATKQV